MEDFFKGNFLLTEGRSNSKHTRATSSDASRMSDPANQGKECKMRHTDSRHNVQGIRSRQDYPVNSQPRRFMRNRSLRKQKVKDIHDTSNS
ncbi:hypothetical protein B9Z55_010407 [Caenorhabditis nigoni]|uniref:Uncharacterized protein n=1 Tax=Caenorhabditis nigoni TaxID=1611254 RepID=A0A2G5UFY8_9PELO|nr:hypothetical protein B9Z55_010407 [Caenorhabditis nigoni]